MDDQWELLMLTLSMTPPLPDDPFEYEDIEYWKKEGRLLEMGENGWYVPPAPQDAKPGKEKAVCVPWRCKNGHRVSDRRVKAKLDAYEAGGNKGGDWDGRFDCEECYTNAMTGPRFNGWTASTYYRAECNFACPEGHLAPVAFYKNQTQDQFYCRHERCGVRRPGEDNRQRYWRRDFEEVPGSRVQSKVWFSSLYRFGRSVQNKVSQQASIRFLLPVFIGFEINAPLSPFSWKPQRSERNVFSSGPPSSPMLH